MRQQTVETERREGGPVRAQRPREVWGQCGHRLSFPGSPGEVGAAGAAGVGGGGRCGSTSPHPGFQELCTPTPQCPGRGAAAAKSLQSCPTLGDFMDRSPPGSSVHGDSPGKNTEVEWVDMPSSRGSFPIQGSNPHHLCLCVGRQVLYHHHHLGRSQEC